MNPEMTKVAFMLILCCGLTTKVSSKPHPNSNNSAGNGMKERVEALQAKVFELEEQEAKTLSFQAQLVENIHECQDNLTDSATYAQSKIDYLRRNLDIANNILEQSCYPKDPCNQTKNPCYNGGICERTGLYDYDCHCANSFIGPWCHTKLLCQNLKHPDDGYVSTPNNLTVGSKANYGCHPCYTLEGVSQRTCIVSGEDAEHAEWSDSAPTCIATTPGYMYYAGGSCYNIHANKLNWTDAKDVCKSEGGYLAKITSAEETSSLFPLLSTEFVGPVWIGLVKTDDGDEWVWFTSHTQLGTYNNWAPANPSLEEMRDCVLIDPKGLQWASATCTNVCAFLCEIAKQKRKS